MLDVGCSTSAHAYRRTTCRSSPGLCATRFATCGVERRSHRAVPARVARRPHGQVPALVAGGVRSGDPRAERDDPWDGRCRRPAVDPNGAVEGLRRARVFVFHKLPWEQGKASPRGTTRVADVLVGSPGTAGKRHGYG